MNGQTKLEEMGEEEGKVVTIRINPIKSDIRHRIMIV